MAEAQKLEQYLGTGRRKTAVARVYLRPGKGKITINGKDWAAYFGPRVVFESVMRQPLVETGVGTKYNILVNVAGGGPKGQVEAIRHGISRALLRVSAGNRFVLKKAGFLTRDSRMKERKKYGLRAARRATQFSKR